jgi:PAS domain S-box-containing protein
VLHPLLDRLLRRVGASKDAVPSLEAWQALLAVVARTYHDADQDRYTLERSIDISSREMQGLYQDLKKRSESELARERHRVDESLAILRATLEAMTEGVMVADTNRRVIVANRRFAEMTRVPAEVMASEDHRAIVEHATQRYADPQAAQAEIERLHATDVTSHDELFLVDGTIVDRYSAPVTLPDGERVGRVTFFRDVTAERQARAQLESAREDAEAASNAKSMFVANMSHELRTPLNAVIGIADLMLVDRRDPLTERQREYLQGIATSGRHLLDMVNDVLDLAKIEAGKHELSLEAVRIADSIAEALSLLHAVAQARGVVLASVVEPGTPPVLADRLRLRQILVNLIDNAVKFTDREGSVRVSVRGDSRGVAIRVADTGIGIARENIARLFRAFEQLELPSGDRPRGTGLGLALTKRLVDMHGGTIDVTSELGRGTTFTVRLPVA